ncbi:hypothetical protein [Campylobacter hominis]|mgnify:CR=1 FL=1
MFKKIFMVFLLVFLGGCVKPDFDIKTSEADKFSDPSIVKIDSYNNRLSDKSICDGKHIDDKGLYIDSSFIYDKNKNSYKTLLFASYTTATQAGSGWVGAFCDKQGFMPIKQLIFLADTKRIVVNMSPDSPDIKYSGWNDISRGFDGIYTESSVGPIKLNDLELIANAKILDVKVVGGKYSQTFDNNELEKDFRDNLKKFIAQIKNKFQL